MATAKPLSVPSFSSFRDRHTWENFILSKLQPLEKDISHYLEYWYKESRASEHAYPSQGMLLTPFDQLACHGQALIPPEEMVKILRVRQYFLELFNHPERIKQLLAVDKKPFVPPPKVTSTVIEKMIGDAVGLTVGDLGIAVAGSQGDRIARSERLVHGPFIKLGRHARMLFVGAAMPDIYGSVNAISTMAQAHCLVSVPRNGVFTKVERQADLVAEVWKALESSEVLLGRSKAERDTLLQLWRLNVMGVLEVETDKALHRFAALWKQGVRTFRLYSPEPGKAALEVLKAIRKEYGDEPELFVGQVVDTKQAQQLEAAGADGLYIGIGGGGRCITGVRSGSVVDWSILLWQLRGRCTIPVIVEGGASDNIAVTLALGASGIGVSRIAGGGTIESPGGMLYCIDEHGEFFKPYGGEASARTKYLDGKMLPFGIPSFVEGETRAAYMRQVQYGVPTIPFHLFNLVEDAILSLVFRGVESVADLQAIDPSPLRRNTAAGSRSQHTH